jgi:mono/diheme cytochrome c family protein
MSAEKPANAPRKSGPRSILIGVLVVFFMLALAGGTILYTMSGWSAPARARSLKNPFPSTPDTRAGARTDYVNRCQSCHGANGDGKGERADKLSIAPADFGDAHAMKLRTEGEMFWIITEGHKPMPAFRGTLTDEQRWHLVDFVRTFAHN